MNVQKIAIILVHAFVGWMLCLAAIGIGRVVTTMEIILIVRAILALIFFSTYLTGTLTTHSGQRKSI
jgi:hypothetical protein